jgi:hypothetical protein
VASLRSPLLSITSTPRSCGAVAGSASSNSSLRSLTRSGFHRDSDKKDCSRCTAGCCAPATGSAPASALVSLTAGLGALAATLLLCAALAAPRSHASPPPPPVGVT